MLTQQAANIINQLENEIADDDVHLTQEAIDIISELEDNNANNDDGNNALLESPANAQQLTRESLQCLIDDNGWIENEVILRSKRILTLLNKRLLDINNNILNRMASVNINQQHQ
jgi:hypothetical protein